MNFHHHTKPNLQYAQAHSFYAINVMREYLFTTQEVGKGGNRRNKFHSSHKLLS